MFKEEKASSSKILLESYPIEQSHIIEQKTQEQQFNPYVYNAGTVLTVGGQGFFIVAGDTRLSKGYTIISRETSKIQKLTDNTYLATSGMYADFIALVKNLKGRLQIYEYNNEKLPSTSAIATLLSRTLYGKRFFPYYTFNCLVGFDEKNNGVCYGYDAIGSFDQHPFVIQGSAQQIIVPLLDTQLVGYNMKEKTYPQSKEDLIKVIVDAFQSAAERDIYTGDQVEIMLVEKGKEPVKKVFQLRKD